MAAGFKTPGQGPEPQVAVEEKVSGDGTGQGNEWYAVPDLSGGGDPAWTPMFVCGILMAALSVW